MIGTRKGIKIMPNQYTINKNLETFKSLAKKHTEKEIAEILNINQRTVRRYVNQTGIQCVKKIKRKTIEDYEKKSGDKLHGVVVVPFFTTIFKEEAKSLAVPNITIKLPNGQTLATSATKGFATGAKSTVSSIVKATATATVKTKVIAVVCVATILAGTSESA